MVSSHDMKKIIDLKDQLARTFEMKYLGEGNQILEVTIHSDNIGRNTWLIQNSNIENIL